MIGSRRTVSQDINPLKQRARAAKNDHYREKKMVNRSSEMNKFGHRVITKSNKKLRYTLSSPEKRLRKHFKDNLPTFRVKSNQKEDKASHRQKRRKQVKFNHKNPSIAGSTPLNIFSSSNQISKNKMSGEWNFYGSVASLDPAWCQKPHLKGPKRKLNFLESTQKSSTNLVKKKDFSSFPQDYQDASLDLKAMINKKIAKKEPWPVVRKSQSRQAISYSRQAYDPAVRLPRESAKNLRKSGILVGGGIKTQNLGGSQNSLEASTPIGQDLVVETEHFSVKFMKKKFRGKSKKFTRKNTRVRYCFLPIY